MEESHQAISKSQKGCIFAALLLWGSSVPLYLWQLILAFQFGKGVSIGAGIISGLISALMLTGLGDYVWKYVFVCWTGRVPYTYCNLYWEKLVQAEHMCHSYQVIYLQGLVWYTILVGKPLGGNRISRPESGNYRKNTGSY